MNIFEKNGSRKSISSCGYCRTGGHDIRECPQVAVDYSYWKDHIVPLKAGNPCHWFTDNQPKYWGEWYTKCIMAMQKQLDYKKKQRQPKAHRTAAPRSCGFCEELGHTRRTCEKMKTFLVEAYQANENWRRLAYDILVKQLGISVGAAIKVKKSVGYYSNETTTEHIALVSSVNWDKLNLSCANQAWDDKWRQHLRVEVLVDGVTSTLKFNSNTTETTLSPTFRHICGYSGVVYEDKVAPAPKPLDEAWVTNYKEAFDFIAKKRSYEKLEECGIATLVENWK